jgi:hypothetical protein
VNNKDYILTNTALLGGSLRPKNYTTRTRPSVRDNSHVPKRKTISWTSMDASREGNNKSAAKPEKSFLEKEKHMHFAATQRRK